MECDPKDFEEYSDRCSANITIGGFGAETYTMLCCPVCGAANWLKFPVTAGLDGYKAVTEPTECKVCHRVCKLNIATSPSGSRQQVEFVSGEPVPDFLKFIFGVVGTVTMHPGKRASNNVGGEPTDHGK